MSHTARVQDQSLMPIYIHLRRAFAESDIAANLGARESVPQWNGPEEMGQAPPVL